MPSQLFTKENGYSKRAPRCYLCGHYDMEKRTAKKKCFLKKDDPQIVAPNGLCQQFCWKTEDK